MNGNQDWEPVMIRKRGTGSGAAKAPQAVNAVSARPSLLPPFSKPRPLPHIPRVSCSALGSCDSVQGPGTIKDLEGGFGHSSVPSLTHDLPLRLSFPPASRPNAL